MIQVEPMKYIDRSEIVAALEARGEQARAAWVERALPKLVDIHKNSALLQMLNIDLSTMSAVDAAGQPSAERSGTTSQNTP